MPCAMPRFRWPPGQAGSGVLAGPVPLHQPGRDYAVPADRFCERDEVVEHCGCHP